MIKKLKSKLNNRGSSFVMLIVTVTFLSVLATSILVAVGFSYRLKVYNLNSRNNFYYVEQALDEIYAGVGNIAVDNLRQAYSDTLEILVYYDTTSKEYVPMADSDANLLMKKTFMQYMKNDTSLSMQEDTETGNGETYLVNTLSGYVTNPDIILDLSNVQLDVTNTDAVIIRNITVKREAKYSGGSTTGDYIQSITTDITIGEPAYNVSFSQDSALYNSLYDFALIADMGIEITGAGNSVNISGNVYAAADFYNKDYYVEENGTEVLTNTFSGKTTDVSSYKEDEDRYEDCDGLQETSMYSGLYISGANVILQSNMVVIPGSLSVFNGGQLVVSAKEKGTVVKSELWVDNITLGGYTPVAGASRADIYANAYVYDDLTLDATESSLRMSGEYYGYNYSQSVDTRSFLSSAAANYQNDGTNTNNHYNSSSIILNGQDSSLDFSDLEELYIAGRSYIEMSKKITKTDATISDDEVVETRTYTYDNSIEDYITGESLSVKSNQLAYMPIKTWSITEEEQKDGTYKYYVTIPSNVQEPYKGFFDTLSKVPVIKQTVSGTDYYFFNFGAEEDANGEPIYKDVDKTEFIQAYAKYFATEGNGEYTNSGAKYLKDITSYTRFEVASITLPDEANIYSNGALTVKDGTTFSILASQSSNDVFETLTTVFSSDSALGAYNTASIELSSQYDMAKYLLTIDSSRTSDVTERQNDSTASAAMTPFETYFNVASITDLASNGTTLENGYRIWVSDGDVTISDDSGSAQGVVLAKGDVTFDSNMTSFRGLIVSGSKIYINQGMNFFADSTIAKATLQMLDQMSDSSTTAEKILACFKEYTTSGSDDSTSTSSGSSDDTAASDDVTSLEKKITEIDYNDVISFVNWKKNVE